LVKWDKFVIPKPFARIAVAVGPPRYVPRTMDAAAVERLQADMEIELKRLYEEAKSALSAKSS
jgi:lysophospholipid acyltransferase (LPLAT)-like uncharacterized protein